MLALNSHNSNKMVGKVAFERHKNSTGVTESK